jgi:hypothetical protein
MKNIFLVLSLIAILGGCSRKEVQRKEHDGPGGETVTDQVADVSEAKTELEKLNTSVQAKVSANATSHQILVDIYRPLAAILFAD